ncbi:hypothetical protein AB4259_22060 [Vibrio amylolyticus]|uniref:hypothetical protein n=1 Tax=Vibrio amylolyticus TaxID=2847292 RepID=UPI00354AF296
MPSLKKNWQSPSVIASSLFYAVILLLGSASVFKSAGLFNHSIRQVELALGGAVYLHLIGAVVLGFIAHLSSCRTFLFGISLNAVLLMILVVIDESLQYVIPARHFSWLDMSVNVIGVLAGNYFAFFFLRKSTYIE